MKCEVSKYRYPFGYEEIDCLSALGLLRKLLPDLSGQVCPEQMEVKLHGNAEGRYIIPRWRAVGETYCQATARMFGVLSHYLGSSFESYCNEELQGNEFNLTEQTARGLLRIEGQQPGCDFLFVQAQFGKVHAGKTLSQVNASLREEEFLLGPFEGACMLLTNPGRLVSEGEDSLWLSTPGAQIMRSYNKDQVHVPGFAFYQGKIQCGTGEGDGHSERFGTVTAFA